MPLIAPATFSTDRLWAERLTDGHYPELRLIDGDPEVMKTFGGAVYTEEETREALKRNLERWERHGYGIWIFYLRDTREFVGRSTLQHFDLDGSDAIEVGYAVRPQYWNQGYATEMAKALLKIAFEDLGKTKIYALTLPTNQKSQRVMQKSGFTYERDFIYKEKWPSVLYGITVARWRAAPE